jgi:hypothetical protein
VQTFYFLCPLRDRRIVTRRVRGQRTRDKPVSFDSRPGGKSERNECWQPRPKRCKHLVFVRDNRRRKIIEMEPREIGCFVVFHQPSLGTPTMNGGFAGALRAQWVRM